MYDPHPITTELMEIELCEMGPISPENIAQFNIRNSPEFEVNQVVIEIASEPWLSKKFQPYFPGCTYPFQLEQEVEVVSEFGACPLGSKYQIVRIDFDKDCVTVEPLDDGKYRQVKIWRQNFRNLQGKTVELQYCVYNQVTLFLSFKE